MFLKVLRDICRPQWIDIIMVLKRSQGLPVGEIAKYLGKSYMGIKQHCIELEKLGYVDTWRHPQKTGRPLKLYRLTEKVLPLFPNIGEELGLELLESVREGQGNLAPERMLTAFMGDKTTKYKSLVKGKTSKERAKSFAAIREAEGYVSSFDPDAEGKKGAILEYHSLFQGVESRYPTIARMEEQLFSNVLGCSVARTVEEVSGGLKTYRFSLS